MRVAVNPQRCRGHARCLTIAPNAFEFLDLEDRAVASQNGIALEDKDLIRRAEQECPERAIKIDDLKDA
ncbi:ferredoxin [Mycobacterium seoulense]